MDFYDRGYRAKAPTHQAAHIDAEVCARSKCRKCGHHGMRYEPWSRPGSYLALAVCPRCGHQEEF
jgi:ribosomal protein L40E